MNKITKKLITVALSGALCTGAIGLTACEDKPVTAYEIAVANGFVGSEQDWLNSLKGTSGNDGADLDITALYNAAVASGEFDGTFLEFLRDYLSVNVQEDNDTQTIAQNVSSVVSICAGFQKDVRVEGFFGYSDETLVSYAEGSGVIIRLEENDTHATAYIVTNYHVIHNTADYTDSPNGISQDIYVYPYGAREGFTTGDVATDRDDYLDEGGQMGDFTGDGIRATFVGGAMDYDIAVLKVTDSAYLKDSAVTAATLGDSGEATLGEKVFVIGNANGKGISVTMGIVSVETEKITLVSSDGRRYVDYRVMRTDAAINHGNSGGGLFNANGELIGITNAKTVKQETDNMGYALPISQVSLVVDKILETATETTPGCVRCGHLGIITYLNSSKSVMTESGKIKIEETFRVSSVETGVNAGAAQNLLQVGDVILAGKINDGEWLTFTRRYLFADMLLQVNMGDTITFRILRENEEMEVEIPFTSNGHFKQYS